MKEQTNDEKQPTKKRIESRPVLGKLNLSQDKFSIPHTSKGERNFTQRSWAGRQLISCQKGLLFFIIMLIICLPIAHADMLTISKISGTDNANNFIRQNDLLEINALINMPGDPTIERDQLRIYQDTSTSFANFETCQKIGTGSLCVFRKNLYSQSGTHDYHIELFTDSTKTDLQANPEEKITESLTVDIVSPVIKAFNFAPKITATGSIALTYEAEDYSEGTTKTICSGIQNIKITKEDFSNEVTIIPGNNQCEISGSYSTTISDEGKYNVCAFAVENMGRVSKGICKEIVVDKSAPIVQNIYFYKNGERITHIGKQASTLVDIEIIFDELSLDNVNADFSMIARGSASSVQATIKDNKATFSSIPVGGFTNCAFNIIAEDKVNNILNSNVQCQIGLDEDGPEILGFESNRKDDNINLVGGEAEFTLRFKEEKSGIDKDDVFLDLSRIGMGANVRAKECQPQNNEWICKWDVSATRGSGKQQITVLGADRVGNPLTGIRNYDVVVDLTKPKVDLIKVWAINDPEKSVFIADDMLEFEFSIDDFGSAYADLTKIGHSTNVLPHSCINEEISGKNITKCFWGPITIMFSDPGKVKLPFYFFDKAGNKVVKTVVIDLLEKLDVNSPDFWKIKKIECSPNPVDRSVTSIIPQGYKVVCRVDLKSKRSGARVTHISFDKSNCEGDFSGKIFDITATNTGPAKKNNKKDVYLSIILDHSDFLIPSFQFKCPLHISTRIGKRYITNSEEETAAITLNFFDNPLGTTYHNYDRKIHNAKKQANKIWSITKKFESFFEKSKKICEIKSIFTNILGILDSLIAIFTGVAKGLKAIPVTAVVGEGLDSTARATCAGPKSALENSYVGEASEYVKKIKVEELNVDLYSLLEEFCRFINCNLEGNKAPNGAYFKNMGEKILSLKTLAGGGAPWCTDTIGWMNKQLGQIKLEGMASIDPKESLILSVGCLCLPGIIKNLNELAEVKCKYAICMKEKVKEGGFPASVCETEEAYDECMFIYGEVFNAIPIITVLSNIFNKWERMLSNWPGLIFALVGGAVCSDTLCHEPLAYIACIVTKTLDKILDALASIKSITNKDHWKPQTGYCKELFD